MTSRRHFIAGMLIVGALFGAAPSFAAGCDLTAAQAASDPRLAHNPLLEEIAVNAPDRLPGLLCDLDRVEHTRFRAIVPGARPTVGERATIDGNPAIAAAYAVNPEPMLELLKRMIEAARKKS
jgi:hypothetical protein